MEKLEQRSLSAEQQETLENFLENEIRGICTGEKTGELEGSECSDSLEDAVSGFVAEHPDISEREVWNRVIEIRKEIEDMNLEKAA
ncbi:MAG: hypothetical protein KGH93_03045 [Patescibacteria group bacterium]|nr:hypothetical protein [Patescibacteria group bacterium]MDE1946147.1 hypothetical protein [Patescibacteria group bacterium]